MTRCHYGREPLRDDHDNLPAKDAPGARTCAFHAMMKTKNAQSSTRRFERSIIVSHGGVGPLGTWYRVEAFVRGELVYCKSGATSQEDAYRHATEYLKGMR